MTYTDNAQRETVYRKMQLIMEAIAEIISDNDEAMDSRQPEDMESETGLSLCMPAPLSYYSSTGMNPPLIDRLIEKQLKLQGDEWARQYPQRASLTHCVMNEGEFQDEARKWEDAALDDEYVYSEIEVYLIGDYIKFSGCLMNEISVPYHDRLEEEFTIGEFLNLEGEALEGLAESPYRGDSD